MLCMVAQSHSCMHSSSILLTSNLMQGIKIWIPQISRQAKCAILQEEIWIRSDWMGRRSYNCTYDESSIQTAKQANWLNHTLLLAAFAGPVMLLSISFSIGFLLLTGPSVAAAMSWTGVCGGGSLAAGTCLAAFFAAIASVSEGGKTVAGFSSAAQIVQKTDLAQTVQ